MTTDAQTPTSSHRGSVAAAAPIAVAQGVDVHGCTDELGRLANNAARLPHDRYLEALVATQRAVDSRARACRVAIVAQTPELLVRRHRLLAKTVSGGRDLGFLRKQGVFPVSADAPPRTAVLFPGQGTQYPNMLRQVASRFPIVEETLAHIDATYERLCGRPLRPSFWVDDVEEYEERDEDIPCALFAVSCALFNLVRAYGLRVDAVMGQSIGDIAALVAGGVLSIDDGLEVVRERNLSVLSLDIKDPGRMITLLCPAEKAERLIGDLGAYAVLAAYNSPSACIVSVSAHGADALIDRCSREGIVTAPIAISHAYHSRITSGAEARYRQILAGLSFNHPQCDVVSSITGGSILDMDSTALVDDLVHQLDEPVQMQTAIRYLYDSGVRLFLECGPKWALTTYVEGILANQPHVAQATLHPKTGELEQIYRALACLFANGVAGLSAQMVTTCSRSATDR